MAGLLWNQWQLSCGTGGSFAVESVAGFTWNRWQLWRGIRNYTTVYKVFARWADDGSLWQAFVASVRHLAVEKQLDLSVLHGDGTNTVAKKGAMVSDSRGTNIRKARRSSPLRRTKAMS